MRTAVDYFGLMAYMWVMSGGMPDGDLLSPAERKPIERRTRTGRRLRVFEGGLAKGASTAARRRKTADADEAAA